jgi:hypothetical protein
MLVTGCVIHAGNGNFAALLFINHWEYTQNLTFAREQVYPLLEGLNAWWGCFLDKVPTPGGGYVYADTSTADPDNEHENQLCANPQIGLAFIKRSLIAQLEIGAAIGTSPDPVVADMLAHFPDFNIAACNTADCIGKKIWTECTSHSVSESDGFSLYPIWPSELINSLNSSAWDLALARNSLMHYSEHGHGQIKTVHLPSMMVRAGMPPKQILVALNGFLQKNQRASFVPKAPGGGTENIGIAVAINDMLVQSPTREYIVLFPNWDKTQDASFSNLLVKGAVEVSATWVSSTSTTTGVSVVARHEHVGPVILDGVRAHATVTCADGSTPTTTSVWGRLAFTAPRGVRCHIG